MLGTYLLMLYYTYRFYEIGSLSINHITHLNDFNVGMNYDGRTINTWFIFKNFNPMSYTL